jgi:hypothetical protein
MSKIEQLVKKKSCLKQDFQFLSQRELRLFFNNFNSFY